MESSDSSTSSFSMNPTRGTWVFEGGFSSSLSLSEEKTRIGSLRKMFGIKYGTDAKDGSRAKDGTNVELG
jgi:hypothetical protein